MQFTYYHTVCSTPTIAVHNFVGKFNSCTSGSKSSQITAIPSSRTELLVPNYLHVHRQLFRKVKELLGKYFSLSFSLYLIIKNSPVEVAVQFINHDCLET